MKKISLILTLVIILTMSIGISAFATVTIDGTLEQLPQELIDDFPNYVNYSNLAVVYSSINNCYFIIYSDTGEIFESGDNLNSTEGFNYRRYTIADGLTTTNTSNSIGLTRVHFSRNIIGISDYDCGMFDKYTGISMSSYPAIPTGAESYNNAVILKGFDGYYYLYAYNGNMEYFTDRIEATELGFIKYTLYENAGWMDSTISTMKLSIADYTSIESCTEDILKNSDGTVFFSVRPITSAVLTHQSSTVLLQTIIPMMGGLIALLISAAALRKALTFLKGALKAS